MNAEFRLTTRRLELRPFRHDDAVALAHVFDDPYASRFYPGMNELPKAAEWIARNHQRYRNDGFGLWAACLRRTGELVGDCGLIWQSIEESREVEVGYHLRADLRGHGLASEAARACLAYGFGPAGCPRLVSMVHPENHASRQLAERLHRHTRRFERLGELYCLFYTDRDEWRPT